jgi:hypothetical protein
MVRGPKREDVEVKEEEEEEEENESKESNKKKEGRRQDEAVRYIKFRSVKSQGNELSLK